MENTLGDIINWFNTVNISLYLTIASFILAIISIYLAIFFYIKGKRKKEPSYIKSSYNIIQDFSSKLSDLDIRYKDEIVNNLTITKIVIWNGGNETVRNTDIAEADPITLYSENGVKILNAEIIKCSNKVNNASISKIINNNSINFAFDFFDRDQGVVIQIIHTGISSRDINVGGTIKGFGNLKYIDLPRHRNLRSIFPTYLIRNTKLKSKHLGYIIFLTLLLATILGILVLIFEKENKEVGLVLTITYGIMIIPSYYIFVKIRMPKSLDIIDDEDVTSDQLTK